MSLKYLFTAHFADNTAIKQFADDRSTLEPDKRNTYYDVREKEKTTKLTAFEFKSPEHTYFVSLIDGHFAIDGVPFFMHEPLVKSLPEGRIQIMHFTDFRLIYFKQHQQDVIVTGNDRKEGEHRVTYHMGWQATVDGENVQRVMKLL